MREHYRHLRKEDRDVIYRMNKARKSQSEIAYTIGFSQSTISKELKRNRGQRNYRPKQAQTKALERRYLKHSRPRKLVGTLKEKVVSRLKQNHSPEQISGALRLEGVFISHETIYRFLALDKLGGGRLYRHLRINSKRRYKHRNKASREKIPNRVDISERPASVNKRLNYGHWEVDLVEGAKGSGYILSLYERKSRFALISKLESKQAELTAQNMIDTLDGYKAKSLTYDNGLEFAKHQKVSEKLGSQAYFCQPYCSWEKGGVENYNGLLRQYFPKGSDFSKISEERLQFVQEEINHRPRKILGYQSPSQKASNIAA